MKLILILFLIAQWVYPFWKNIIFSPVQLNAPELIYDDHDIDAESFLNSQQKNKVKILFWNINHGGAFSAYLTAEKKSFYPLENNLMNLLEFKPDIIVLAEYTQKKFPYQNTLMKKFESHFTENLFYPYNPENPHFGIKILSLVPLKQIASIDLDYAENDQQKLLINQACQKDAILFKRILPLFEMTLAQKKINWMPIHLAQPWDCYKKKYSIFNTFFEIYFGVSSPLYTQLNFLLEHKNKIDLMLGDFNLPDQNLFLNSNLYKKITQNFEDKVVNISKKSFPASSFKPFFPISYLISGLRIDHVFASKNVLAQAYSIPLQGSDHYPIWIQINTL